MMADSDQVIAEWLCSELRSLADSNFVDRSQRYFHEDINALGVS